MFHTKGKEDMNTANATSKTIASWAATGLAALALLNFGTGRLACGAQRAATQPSVDGIWSITCDTPMGTRKAVLSFKTVRGTLVGKLLTRKGGLVDVGDLKLSGDTLSWTLAVAKPVPHTLKFSGTVSGDTISGVSEAVGFFSAPFSGTRQK
jgi:hypothetical protein